MCIVFYLEGIFFFFFGGGGHNYQKMHFFLSIKQLQASKQKEWYNALLKI